MFRRRSWDMKRQSSNLSGWQTEVHREDTEPLSMVPDWISICLWHRENKLSGFAKQDFENSSCPLGHTGCSLQFEPSFLLMLCLKRVALRKSVTKRQPLANPAPVHTLKKATQSCLYSAPLFSRNVLWLRQRKMRNRERGNSVRYAGFHQQSLLGSQLLLHWARTYMST